ncbi:MAG: TolC family protein [Casimicrobiaceae bacterium]
MNTIRAELRCSSLASIVAGLLLSGCATFSQDGGLDTVRSLARERVAAELTFPDAGAKLTSTSDIVKEALAQPLTADAAVQLAVLNNPGLRAAFSGLGIAEADLVQAGRLANPLFSFENKRSREAQSIERTLLLNLVSLATLPLRQVVAGRQFEAAQLELATDVVRLAGDTRKAWVSAVAAQESVKYFEQVRLAAEASAELAARMAQVGNFNKLTRMREQAFYADATAQLAKAKLAAGAERERLTRLLGLAGPDIHYRLPERLPELPANAILATDAERSALARRLDVQMAKRSTEAIASNLGLTRAIRFINVLELGYVNESETGERRKNGYEIEVEIPIFDWGQAKLARAEATYMQSVHRTAQVALNAQSEVRESYQAYRATYDIARHYRDEVVPLRKRIADENTLRYNGMLIGVFELLADARVQIASVNAYLDALRDFWIAQTDLDLALNGGSPSGAPRMRAATMPAGGSAGGH